VSCSAVCTGVPHSDELRGRGGCVATEATCEPPVWQQLAESQRDAVPQSLDLQYCRVAAEQDGELIIRHRVSNFLLTDSYSLIILRSVRLSSSVHLYLSLSIYLCRFRFPSLSLSLFYPPPPPLSLSLSLSPSYLYCDQ
jgi:hypothetical protein